MSYFLNELFSYSILIAVLFSLIKRNVFDKKFQPFLFFIWAGLLSEILSSLMILKGFSNAAVTNVYVLIEAFLITWQFKNWGLFNKVNKWFYGILIIFLCVWITENFIISKITQFSSYFRIVYSFAVVLMSISMINRIILIERKSLIKNPVFIICLTFIIYFTYKVLLEIFWLYGLNSSRDFRVSVYNVLKYINLFANLIYALAILWIPRKREYMLL